MAPETTAPTVTPNPTIVTTPSELSRFLGLAMAKNGAGNPPFMFIDLSVGNGILSSTHINAGGDTSARLWARTAPGAPGEFATNEPQRLLDYIDGKIFTADEQISVTAADAKITISGARRSVRMSAGSVADVPRSTFADPYGVAINGCYVNTAPTRRPVDNSPWSAWTAKGYQVVTLPLAEVQSILGAGKVAYKRYRNAVVRFDISDRLTATVQDSRDTTADLIELGQIAAQVEPGSPTGKFGLVFEIVEPLLASIATLKTESVVMVRHPDEIRVNFLGNENNVIGLTYTSAIHQPPKAAANA